MKTPGRKDYLKRIWELWGVGGVCGVTLVEHTYYQKGFGERILKDVSLLGDPNSEYFKASISHGRVLSNNNRTKKMSVWFITLFQDFYLLRRPQTKTSLVPMIISVSNMENLGIFRHYACV